MKVSLALLFAGFKQSYAKIKDAKNQKELDQVFFALFETLSWIYTIDERVKEIGDLEGVDAELKEIMRAIRYARNRVQHQWAEIIYCRDDATFPATFPVTLFEWVWMSLDKVPQSPNKKFEDPDGKNKYIVYLENEAVRHSLTLIYSKIVMIESIDANTVSLNDSGSNGQPIQLALK